MTIAITHKGLGHLIEAVSDSDTTMKLTPGEAQAFTNVDGDDIYALLRGTIEREIVKIDVAASDLGNGELVVARGQGGSIANAWPSGSLILAVTNADHYNSIQQRGKYRTIDYNPNDSLTPLFTGEKVYQSGPAGCERWWKSYNDIDPYWDIITGLPCGSEVYKDIGWLFDLLVPDVLICWQQYFIPALWDLIRGTWDGDSYTDGSFVILEATVGTWQEDFRPLLMRITRPVLTSTRVILKDTSNFTIVDQTKDVGPNGAEFDLSWTFDNDMERLTVFTTDLTNIEFFECELEPFVSSAADGRVNASDVVFATARAQDPGDGYWDTATYDALYVWLSGGTYSISRLFFFFDLSSITFSQIFSAVLELHRFSYTGVEVPTHILQESTAAAPLSINDFQAFTGPPFCDPVLSQAGVNKFEFNAAGLTYLEGKFGSVAVLCLRDYKYDYSNLAPTTVNFVNYYMNETGGGNVPTLKIYGE